MEIWARQTGQKGAGITIADLYNQVVGAGAQRGRGPQIKADKVAIETAYGMPIEPCLANPIKAAAAQTPFFGGVHRRQIEVQLIGGPATADVDTGPVFVRRVPAVWQNDRIAGDQAQRTARRPAPPGFVQRQPPAIPFATDRLTRHGTASRDSTSRD
jgi:hypothetical protein